MTEFWWFFCKGAPLKFYQKSKSKSLVETFHAKPKKKKKKDKSNFALRCWNLAEAVDDDECSSQEVTVWGVFSHDVLVPQLDGNEGSKQLAQLLDQQVELTLHKHTQY